MGHQLDQAEFDGMISALQTKVDEQSSRRFYEWLAMVIRPTVISMLRRGATFVSAPGDDIIEDVLTQSFLIAWECVMNGKMPSDVNGAVRYCHAIVGNVFRNRMRKEKNHLVLQGELAVLPEAANSFDAASQIAELRSRLGVAEQQVLDLLLDNFRVQEIAVKLEISMSKVYRLINRIREEIRQLD
jgi:RNA polymerase sigma factor (sigma-70 family)